MMGLSISFESRLHAAFDNVGSRVHIEEVLFGMPVRGLEFHPLAMPYVCVDAANVYLVRNAQAD